MKLPLPHITLRWSKIRFLLFVGIIALCVSIVILPAYQHITANVTLVEEAKQARDNQNKHTNTIGQTRSVLAAVRGQEAALQKLFLNSGDELALITQLEKIANALDLEQTILLADTRASSVATMQERPLEITVTGSLPQAFKFLTQLEFVDPLLVIKNVRFTSSPDVKAAVSMTLSAQAFVRL